MGHKTDDEMEGSASNKPPCWIHTFCILMAWKKQSSGSSIFIPPLQVEIAKDNLAKCVEEDVENSDSNSHEFIYF
jgi:hypothetical protein